MALITSDFIGGVIVGASAMSVLGFVLGWIAAGASIRRRERNKPAPF